MLNCNTNKQQVGRKDGGATKGQIHSSYLDLNFQQIFFIKVEF